MLNVYSPSKKSAGTGEGSFHCLAKTFVPESWSFLHNVQMWLKRFKFFKKMFLHKKYLWPPISQFWQLWRKIFAWNTNYICSMPKSDKKNLKISNRYKVLQNFLMEIMNAVLKKVHEKILIIAKDFCSICESIIKLFFKKALPKCSSGHAHCISDKFFEMIPTVD